jgi:polyisoprenoid-binding protein YceI
MTTLPLSRPAACVIALALGLAAAASAAETYAIDPVHTFALFRIKHMGVGFTYGRIDGAEGTVTFDAADPTKNAIVVTIKAEGVNTGNEARDKHIKGPDFFDAKQFPTLSFKSTSFTAVDAKAGTYDVAGEFSLHGVTKPLTVRMTNTGAGESAGTMRIGFETVFTIKRSDFGMSNMIPGASDEVQITFSTEGTLKK